MVIGTGLMARAFSHYKKRKGTLIFASGVSNSGETQTDQFSREQNLILDIIKNHKNDLFIYFSTCSIEDKDLLESPYVNHKLNIERIIRQDQNNYLIFRLPQVVGRTSNQFTLMNFLFNHIKDGIAFNLWGKAVRYIIDIEDVNNIVTYIIDNRMFHNQIINITSRPFKILEIVQAFENILNKTAIYDIINKGSFYEIDCSELTDILKILEIKFDKNYLDKVIRKYYSPIQNTFHCQL